MPIYKAGHLHEDDWLHLDDEILPAETACTVPAARWLEEKEELKKHTGKLGIRVDNDFSIEEIAEELEWFELIVLEFGLFNDGRNFSSARNLRKRFNFSGEIRASGDILPDQLFYLQRVGIDAFELDEKQLPFVETALTELSVRYQSSVDIDTTIFQRRCER